MVIRGSTTVTSAVLGGPVRSKVDGMDVGVPVTVSVALKFG